MSVCPRGCLDPLEGVRWESWSIKNGFGIVSSPRPPVWLFGVAWCRPDWWYHLYRVTSFTPNLLWMNGRSGFHSDFTAYSCRLQLWFVFGVCELQDTCETQSAEVMLLTLTHKKNPPVILTIWWSQWSCFPLPPCWKADWHLAVVYCAAETHTDLFVQRPIEILLSPMDSARLSERIGLIGCKEMSEIP